MEVEVKGLYNVKDLLSRVHEFSVVGILGSIHKEHYIQRPEAAGPDYRALEAGAVVRDSTGSLISYARCFCHIHLLTFRIYINNLSTLDPEARPVLSIDRLGEKKLKQVAACLQDFFWGEVGGVWVVEEIC